MSEKFNKEVGRHLYEARKQKGYSRAKVGELVGLHETTVKRYEDGEIKALDIEKIKLFAKALNTPAASLLGWMSRGDEDTDQLLTLSAISEDRASGRSAAREDMFATYADKDSGVVSTRLIGKKYAILSYNVFDSTIVGSEFAGIVDALSGLGYNDMVAIRGMISGYLSRNDRDY